jgi:glucose-1-phosphate adenylyltransferase
VLDDTRGDGPRPRHEESAMARRGEVLALVQAGGQGGRMDVLTRERAKPALPYGGVHRLVDFALSALVHADLVDVWVSLEYQVTSIDDYLSGGRPWSLDRNRGGFRRMVPQTGTGPATESGFAHGNGDLLLRMSADLETFGASTLVVCSADHVFNMDLGPVIDEHVAAGRVATVLTTEVTKKDASDNVVVVGRRTAPSPPSSTSRPARRPAPWRPRCSSTTRRCS